MEMIVPIRSLVMVDIVLLMSVLFTVLKFSICVTATVRILEQILNRHLVTGDIALATPVLVIVHPLRQYAMCTGRAMKKRQGRNFVTRVRGNSILSSGKPDDTEAYCKSTLRSCITSRWFLLKSPALGIALCNNLSLPSTT
jgi:hypothetical protein